MIFSENYTSGTLLCASASATSKVESRPTALHLTNSTRLFASARDPVVSPLAQWTKLPRHCFVDLEAGTIKLALAYVTSTNNSVWEQVHSIASLFFNHSLAVANVHCSSTMILARLICLSFRERTAIVAATVISLAEMTKNLMR